MKAGKVGIAPHRRDLIIIEHMFEMRKRLTEMHGEYKTPGGKLVVVDFDVVDGRFKNLVISGDFFLYPEEELAPLTNALEGVDVELDDESFAERIRMDIHPDTELLGTSPEGIVTAVRRALDGVES